MKRRSRVAKTKSGAHQERDPHWKLLARFPTDGVWVAGGWNIITGSMVVDELIVNAGSTEGYFECKTLYAPDLNGDGAEEADAGRLPAIGSSFGVLV